MRKRQGEQQRQLVGEIVETIEHDGRTVATIAITSGTLSISLDPVPGVHLGDVLRIDAAIIVKAIKEQLFQPDPDEL